MSKKLLSLGISSLLITAALFALVNFNNLNTVGTNVGGFIVSDTTWDITGSPYFVVDDVVVMNGITLTIEPGVEVKFDGFYTIYVNGTFHAVGNETNRINFSSNMTIPTPNDWDRIQINYTGHAEIKYCNISYGSYGIYIFASNNNITDNYILSNQWQGIHLETASKNLIKGNNISFNNDAGVNLISSTNNDIISNEIYDNWDDGIYFVSSSNNSIIDNKIIENDFGIYLNSFSNNNTISGNYVSNRDDGIYVQLSTNNTITNNNITRNWRGVYLSSSSNNNISNNNVSYNRDDGIFLHTSSHNNLTENDVINNSDGIVIFGDGVYNNKIAFNRVYKNQIGILIFNIAMPMATQSSGHSIINNTISENTIGLSLEVGDIGTIKDVVILSSNIYENDIGISLDDYGSTIKNTTISNCVIEDNRIGIRMTQIGDRNIIVNNNISRNFEYAIYLDISNNNFIYHNNFIKNGGVAQVFDNTNSNIWNDSYPSGGNFWSDYTGFDNFKGPLQDIPGSDGIGDTNYTIDPDSKDYYPLMAPIGNCMFLYEGWNLISIPFIQPETNLGIVLSSIKNSFDTVQWYNISDIFDPWKHNSSKKPSHMNDLESIDHYKGFWIHIIEPGGILFVYSGYKPITPQNITLNPGWNLVGYPSLTNINRTEALNNLNFTTEVDSIWIYHAVAKKWIELDENNLFEMGRGYWIHSKVTKTWEVSL